MAKEPISKCRGCGADIIWIETHEGKKMPVDAKPKAGFTKDFVGNWKHTLLHESHFATCPQAGKFRKGKK